MESITGRRPLLAALGRGLGRADRDGSVFGLALLAAMVALDAWLATPGLVVGMFVLAPFVPAVLGGVVATVSVGALATVAGLASPLWDGGFGEPSYWVTAAGLVLGSGFAIVAARAR